MRERFSACFFTIVALFLVQSVFADDFKDHSLVKPLGGSNISAQEISRLDEYKLALSGVEEKKIATQKLLQGKVTKTVYQATEENSVFEIHNYLKDYFASNGFELIFEIGKEQCNNSFSDKIYNLNPFRSDPNYSVSIPLKNGHTNSLRYLVWKAKKAAGVVYINCFITSGWAKFPSYRIDVIEVASEAPAEVSDNVKSEIATNGKSVSYAIKFAEGEASLSESSISALKPYAELLASSSSLRLFVVDHCSELDSADENQKLSQQRAEAVVKNLIENYNISADRLQAFGAGQFCPVSKNNGAGRSENTRIEFVENLTKPQTQSSVGSKPGFVVPNKPPMLGNPGNKPGLVPPNMPSMPGDLGNKPGSVVPTRPPMPGNLGNKPGFVPPNMPSMPGNLGNKPSLAFPQMAKPEPKKLMRVPSVIGKLRLVGKNTLEKLGFKVKLVGKKVGKVTKQSPSGNSEVDPGAVITLTIGK